MGLKRLEIKGFQQLRPVSDFIDWLIVFLYGRTYLHLRHVLYYTNQCPFNAKYVSVLEETARNNGIPFKAIRIENRKDAQNAPTPITTYALFRDGKYITNEQMSDKKFLKLVERSLARYGRSRSGLLYGRWSLVSLQSDYME